MYLDEMERVANRATSFQAAEEWDRAQQKALSAEERMAIARTLRFRYYPKAPDVRESGACSRKK